MTPPSLRQLYPALPWSPKIGDLCIVDLSMSEISGFADVISLECRPFSDGLSAGTYIQYAVVCGHCLH